MPFVESGVSGALRNLWAQVTAKRDPPGAARGRSIRSQVRSEQMSGGDGGDGGCGFGSSGMGGNAIGRSGGGGQMTVSRMRAVLRRQAARGAGKVVDMQTRAVDASSDFQGYKAALMQRPVRRAPESIRRILMRVTDPSTGQRDPRAAESINDAIEVRDSEAALVEALKYARAWRAGEAMKGSHAALLGMGAGLDGESGMDFERFRVKSREVRRVKPSELGAYSALQTVLHGGDTPGR
jgi:hypothetical protein